MCVDGCFAWVYVITYVPGASGDQKNALGSLELELQMVVSCHVGAETWIGPVEELFVLLVLSPGPKYLIRLEIKLSWHDEGLYKNHVLMYGNNTYLFVQVHWNS